MKKIRYILPICVLKQLFYVNGKDLSVKGDLAIDHQPTPQQILVLFKELSMADRVNIAEAVLHLIQQDLKQMSNASHLSKSRRQQQLAAAAQALLPDYQTDDELTSFTTNERQLLWKQHTPTLPI